MVRRGNGARCTYCVCLLRVIPNVLFLYLQRREQCKSSVGGRAPNALFRAEAVLPADRRPDAVGSNIVLAAHASPWDHPAEGDSVLDIKPHPIFGENKQKIYIVDCRNMSAAEFGRTRHLIERIVRIKHVHAGGIVIVKPPAAFKQREPENMEKLYGEVDDLVKETGDNHYYVACVKQKVDRITPAANDDVKKNLVRIVVHRPPPEDRMPVLEFMKQAEAATVPEPDGKYHWELKVNETDEQRYARLIAAQFAYFKNPRSPPARYAADERCTVTSPMSLVDLDNFPSDLRAFRDYEFGKNEKFAKDYDITDYRNADGTLNLTKLLKIKKKVFADDNEVDGITVANLYMGFPWAAFMLHTEDFDMFSVSYLRKGAPKLWTVTSPEDAPKVRKLLAGEYACYNYSRF